jgi:hypothetical protein
MFNAFANKSLRRRFFITGLIWLGLAQLSSLFEVPGAALAADVSSSAMQSFQTLWQRNDGPVAAGRAQRTWTWGPAPFKTLLEPYSDAPGGQRAVAYYDKSRMELNDPNADKNSQWYITNGLIVREMVSGRIQTGNASYQDSSPAQVAVAGDPLASNPAAPTYATFRKLASLNNDNRAAFQPSNPIIDQIDGNGNLSQNNNLAAYSVRYAYFDQTLGHNVPDVFINFFKSQGTVYQNGSFSNGQVLDWVFACGLPITEPYWTKVKVGGKDATVLVQLFERRVLTYNPANSPEWRVEMGNVGQHYYNWRYSSGSTPAINPAPTPAPTATALPATDGPAFGSVEVVDGQNVLAIGNGSVKRTVVMGKDAGIYTSSLLNRLTATEYMGTPGTEFRLRLSDELQQDNSTAEITSDQIKVTGYNWLRQDNAEQLIELQFSGQFKDVGFQGSLFYDAQANQPVIHKWLQLQPFNGQGWAITGVTLEDWRPADVLNPLEPVTRYPDNNVQDYQNVITANPDTRFQITDRSHALGIDNNGQEGFFFFAESLFGQEEYSRNAGVQVGNSDFVEPEKGFGSGRATLGVWYGPAELGFKRYNEYLYNNYLAVKGKKDPVWYSTWYTYESSINQQNVSAMVDQMKAAGFYNMLHIDAGWEGSAPLQVDSNKFPQGLDPIIGKLQAANMTLGLWINPFSHGYEGIAPHADFRQQHPDWVSPDGARLCPLSGAGDYVRNRLLEMARNWPLDELYWDGADWNPNSCSSTDRRWRTPTEERILTIRYFADLIDQLHAIRPNLRVVVWSAPPDIHWLSSVDQIQFSDISEPALGQSELVRRQQAYYTAFEYHYAGTWGDWYGLQYRRDYSQGLGQPLNLLEFAEVSMLGNNANQAGGSFDLTGAPQNLLDFLKQMFSFRTRFASYFASYQHVLNFPDGQSVEGEAHVFNGQGFILLFNPTASPQTVNIPLDETELELRPDLMYNLSDWSSFTSSQSLGSFKPINRPSITLPANGYKIIGINLP